MISGLYASRLATWDEWTPVSVAGQPAEMLLVAGHVAGICVRVPAVLAALGVAALGNVPG